MITKETIAETEQEFETLRAQWGEGEWSKEPNRIEGKMHGFDFLMHRNKVGSWCGYVGIPEGHPAFGKDYEDIDVEVHGGLTYANACRAPICHIADNKTSIWWLGFDCSHAGDVMPSVIGYCKSGLLPPSLRMPSEILGMTETYKNVAYVKAEIDSLAKQLAEMKKGPRLREPQE